jgi:hypothetical protein
MTSTLTFATSLIVVLATSAAATSAAAQDAWPALPLATEESPPDSLVQAGLLLTPTPGGIDVAIAVAKSCAAAPHASYLAHGAVVKIRLQQAAGRSPCAASGPPQAYRTSVSRLKPKRYQVIVLQADARGRWQPWKAAIAVVP